MAKTKIDKKKEKEVVKTPEEKANDRVFAYFKNHEDQHYNFEEQQDYLVSTGSLQLDAELEGFGPGFHRFFGPTESGKTSQALVIMKNMLDTVPKSKGLYVKAEGRFSKKIQIRSGITFVTDPKEWVHGTCLVVKSNRSEFVFKLIDGIIADQIYEDGTKICGILDSTDGLITANAVGKEYGESAQVAGGAVQASHFAKIAALPAGERGHMLIILSQLRDKIKISAYAAADKQKKAGGSGGNALMHYPDHIWEFVNVNQGDMFLKNGDLQPHFQKNPIVGHNVRFKTLKTPNEKTNMMFEYPIKYGRVAGNSIWVEREVVDFLLDWGFIERKGAWFSLTEDLILEIHNFADEEEEPMLEKIQGMEKLYLAFEARPKLTEHLIKFSKRTIDEAISD
tara:strand:+ start:4624 stop:5808 length:1185 start_codon:yes stop_codon:yes gene_type:complete